MKRNPKKCSIKPRESRKRGKKKTEQVEKIKIGNMKVDFNPTTSVIPLNVKV